MSKTYKTLRGESICLGHLDRAEQSCLRQISAFFAKRPDWIDFGNFWPKKVLDLYEPRGLSRRRMIKTALYQVSQDLASRLAVLQGYARLSDYRDDLAILIQERFGSQKAFCKATGLSEDLVSHVLAGRKHFAIDTLSCALEKIGFQLSIVPRPIVEKKRVKSAG